MPRDALTGPCCAVVLWLTHQYESWIKYIDVTAQYADSAVS